MVLTQTLLSFTQANAAMESIAKLPGVRGEQHFLPRSSVPFTSSADLLYILLRLGCSALTEVEDGTNLFKKPCRIFFCKPQIRVSVSSSHLGMTF